MNQETNIKARFQLFNKGIDKPSMTVYEYNQIQATLSTSGNKIKIGDTIPTDEGDYKVIDISLEVMEEEIPDPQVGFEMALIGTRLPYNFEIQVTLEKI
jgi:hypothetical protein